MTKGDQFTIEWDVDGMLWEVDVEFTGQHKVKDGKTRACFENLVNGKIYKMTKKQFNKSVVNPDDWKMISDGEELEW